MSFDGAGRLAQDRGAAKYRGDTAVNNTCGLSHVAGTQPVEITNPKSTQAADRAARNALLYDADLFIPGLGLLVRAFRYLLIWYPVTELAVVAVYEIRENTMHSDLLDTLKALRTDPSRVVDLYRQLYAASFVVLVQAGSETDLRTARFLTYPSHDGVRELPVFTSRDYVLEKMAPDAVLVTASGHALWPRLLEVVRAGQCQVAVDPGQGHGIRLRENMILGMIHSGGG